jgi:hypothetical protein
MVYNIIAKCCEYCFPSKLRLSNTLPNSKRYVMEPKGFMGYPKRGNACELNSFEHQQYPFDNLNQNN